MKRLLTALLITAAAVVPAYAKTATWFRGELWTVIGDQETRLCMAHIIFDTGRDIAISRDPSGWKMIIGGVGNRQGVSYGVAMAGDNGTYGTLKGVGVEGNAVIFLGLTPQTVLNMAKINVLEVQNLGKFSMKGSMEAILQTNECFKALSGMPASVPARAVPVYEREI